MIPILYEAKTSDFTGNGTGFLKDATECTVKEVRNGTFELTLKYPENGVYADKLIEGLDGVDYIERVKVQQKNWLGRSTGAEVDFPIAVIDRLQAVCLVFLPSVHVADDVDGGSVGRPLA